MFGLLYTVSTTERLGAVHKGRPHSGEGVCPVQTRGGSFFSDLDVRTFWCKNIGFFEIYGKGEGVESVRTFCGKGGRGSIFRHFVRTSFMDVTFLKEGGGKLC